MSSCATWRPMNPQPPVMRTLFMITPAAPDFAPNCDCKALFPWARKLCSPTARSREAETISPEPSRNKSSSGEVRARSHGVGRDDGRDPDHRPGHTKEARHVRSKDDHRSRRDQKVDRGTKWPSRS